MNKKEAMKKSTLGSVVSYHDESISNFTYGIVINYCSDKNVFHVFNCQSEVVEKPITECYLQVNYEGKVPHVKELIGSRKKIVNKPKTRITEENIDKLPLVNVVRKYMKEHAVVLKSWINKFDNGKDKPYPLNTWRTVKFVLDKNMDSEKLRYDVLNELFPYSENSECDEYAQHVKIVGDAHGRDCIIVDCSLRNLPPDTEIYYFLDRVSLSNTSTNKSEYNESTSVVRTRVSNTKEAEKLKKEIESLWFDGKPSSEVWIGKPDSDATCLISVCCEYTNYPC